MCLTKLNAAVGSKDNTHRVLNKGDLSTVIRAKIPKDLTADLAERRITFSVNSHYMVQGKIAVCILNIDNKRIICGRCTIDVNSLGSNIACLKVYIIQTRLASDVDRLAFIRDNSCVGLAKCIGRICLKALECLVEINSKSRITYICDLGSIRRIQYICYIIKFFNITTISESYAVSVIGSSGTGSDRYVIGKDQSISLSDLGNGT